VVSLSGCYSRACSHLADSPSGRCRQSAWSQLARVLRVRRVFLSVFVLILVASCFWQGKVWRTVRLDVADRPHGTGCSRTVRGQGADYPLFEVRY
jgi:hypothetical protein